MPKRKFLTISTMCHFVSSVAKLFGDNEVKKMWPVKLLRAVVVLVVTILFSRWVDFFVDGLC